jgi:hypothetical protein
MTRTIKCEHYYLSPQLFIIITTIDDEKESFRIGRTMIGTRFNTAEHCVDGIEMSE